MTMPTVTTFTESIVTVTDARCTLGEICEALCDDDAQYAAVTTVGDVVGLLSRRELELGEPQLAVAERLPASRPFVVPHDISLDAAAEALTQHPELDAIAVVDPTGQPVGVLTRNGVLTALMEERRSASEIVTSTPPIPARSSPRQRDADPAHVVRPRQCGTDVGGAMLVGRDVTGDSRDITEIKRAEEAIRESEALVRKQLAELNQFYDTAPVGLCVVDADLRVLRLNERLANIMRMPSSQIVGHTLHETVPRNALVIAPIYRQVITTKTPVLNRVMQGPPREGETEKAHYRISFHPLFDETGDVWACSAVVQDLTDEKHIERELRKREEQHATAQRIAQLGHWEREIATNTVFWSDEMCRIVGISPDEFGATVEAALSYIHLEDLARVRENLRAVVAGERPYQIEYRVNRPSDETRVVEAQAHVHRDAGGVPTHLVGTIQDITERKRIEESLAESQRRYGTMLDALAEGVIWLDADGSIVNCNASALRILEMDRDELTNRSSISARWQLQYEDGSSLSAEDHPVNDTLRTGKPLQNYVSGVRRRDDSVTWLSINARPLGPPGFRSPHGVVVSFNDITEQRLVHKELQEQQNKLTHVTRVSTMGEMATGIAHELNQPLSAIATYAYSARGITVGAPPEIAQPLNRLLVKLEEQAVRAGTIVRRLRALVRKSPGERSRTNLRNLIGETFELIGHDLQSAGIIVETAFDEGLGDVLVDPVQIQQVLLNLIRNGMEAMQQTPAEQKQLRVATHAAGRNRVAITVADHGVGFPPQNLDKIFDAFFTTKDDGLGMGLAISRSIVEDHRGRLAVRANEDAGVTFRIVLPATDGALAYP